MQTTELKSNLKIAENLDAIISSQRSMHAFLFFGGSSASREELGLWFAKRILCTNEASSQAFDHGNCVDFIVVDKAEDRESITKDQILELSEKISFKPFGDRFVVLIKHGELINQIAQNKLLKSLEEPVAPVVFIILSESEDALLPTIRSRCSGFCLEDENSEYSQQCMDAAKSFATLVLTGSAYYKKKELLGYILTSKDNQRELATEFLKALEDLLEKEFSSANEKAAKAVWQIEKNLTYIKQMHNVAYTLKQFCLEV